MSSFESVHPRPPEARQARWEVPFNLARSSSEKAAAGRVLVPALMAGAALGMLMVERGAAYTTPGFGAAERATDWGLLLELFGREPAFSRAEAAQKLGLTHLFEVNLSNLYELNIDWDQIAQLPGIRGVAGRGIGLTVVFTDEVLPPVVIEGAHYSLGAGLAQAGRYRTAPGQKHMMLVISTVYQEKDRIIGRQPDQLKESFLHEWGHFLDENMSKEEKDELLPDTPWRSDQAGAVEGFAKAYAARMASRPVLQAESVWQRPTPTEEEITWVTHRLYRFLHWEQVRQDVLSSREKVPPSFKSGIEK